MPTKKLAYEKADKYTPSKNDEITVHEFTSLSKAESWAWRERFFMGDETKIVKESGRYYVYVRVTPGFGIGIKIGNILLRFGIGLCLFVVLCLFIKKWLL